MSFIKKRELTQLVETAPEKDKFDKTKYAAKKLCESLEKGEIKNEDLSIRDLAETFITDRNGNEMGSYLLQNPSNLREDANAVASLSQFSQINGQIFYNELRQAMSLAEFSVHKLFGVIPSTVIDRPEQFAGVSNIGVGETQSTGVLATYLEVEDGNAFPMAGPNQIFTQAPRQKIYGLQTGVTWAEAAADRTGQILARMRSVAMSMAINREQIACNLVIDAASMVNNRYNYKGVQYATYQNSATNFGAANLVSSNGLVDQNNLNSANIALDTMTDPETGLPVADFGNKTLLVTPQLIWTAKRLEVITQLRTGTSSASNTIVLTDRNNQPAEFNVVKSKYLSQAQTAASGLNTTWFFGDFANTFKYVRAADISVQEAVPLTGTLFSNNLLGLWRAWYCESPFVWEPRYMTQNTA